MTPFVDPKTLARDHPPYQAAMRSLPFHSLKDYLHSLEFALVKKLAAVRKLIGEME